MTNFKIQMTESWKCTTQGCPVPSNDNLLFDKYESTNTFDTPIWSFFIGFWWLVGYSGSTNNGQTWKTCLPKIDRTKKEKRRWPPPSVVERGGHCAASRNPPRSAGVLDRAIILCIYCCITMIYSNFVLEEYTRLYADYTQGLYTRIIRKDYTQTIRKGHN